MFSVNDYSGYEDFVFEFHGPGVDSARAVDVVDLDLSSVSNYYILLN